MNPKTQTAVRGQFHKEIENHRNALAELTPMLAAARVRSESIGRAADRLATWAERLDFHIGVQAGHGAVAG